MEDTRELKLYQDTPSTPEILAKIPLLSREDIERKAETFPGQKERMEFWFSTTISSHQELVI